uniref:Secreted protein n=1 Tax=Heterorhabditis bacteriophora TaxID=37862 RepID=A0A1I7WGC1_HETBA
MSIRAIFVIIFRSVLAKSKFDHLCKGEYFRCHVNWIPATMACCMDIQVFITSGISPEICIYLNERWTRIFLYKRDHAYYFVVFFEIKN